MLFPNTWVWKVGSTRIQQNTWVWKAGKTKVRQNTWVWKAGDDGGTDHYIYKTQALAANATFEHTSKIVLNAGDMLGFITGGAADVDVVVNYLEQTL